MNVIAYQVASRKHEKITKTKVLLSKNFAAFFETVGRREQQEGNMLENLSGSASSMASNTSASASEFAGSALDGIIGLFMKILDILLVKVGIMIPLALFALLVVMICIVPVIAKLTNAKGWFLFAGAVLITFFGIYFLKEHSALAFPIFQDSIDQLTSHTWEGKMVIESESAKKSFSFLTAKTVVFTSPLAWCVFLYCLHFLKTTLADDKMKFFEKVKLSLFGSVGSFIGFWLVTYSTILQMVAPQVIVDYLFSISFL